MHRVLILFLLLVSPLLARAQPDTLAPYQKNRSLPAFTIRLIDNVTIFNTGKIPEGKPSIFILFSPDCDHCARLAKQINDSITVFDPVNLYMISPPMPLSDIRHFAVANGLADKKQIVVGQDTDFFFGSYFHAETVPFVVLYDKNKKLAATLKKLKTLPELRSAMSTLLQ